MSDLITVEEVDFISCDSPICQYCAYAHSVGEPDVDGDYVCDYCTDHSEFVGIECYKTQGE